jgi:hypothetical protein
MVVCGGTYDIMYVDVLIMEPLIYVMGLWMCDVVAENFLTCALCSNDHNFFSVYWI